MRLLIASDVALYRETLSLALGSIDEFDVVGSPTDVGEAWEVLVTSDADVLVLDCGFPGGIDLVNRVAGDGPECGIVIVGIGEVQEEVPRWAAAGATAFVASDSSLHDLHQTLVEVGRGCWRAPPEITEALIRAARISRPLGRPVAPASLTDREYEVALLLDRGCSNKEIARELGIRVPTVKNHVSSILSKLALRRRGQAGAWVRNQRLRRSRAS